jgi:hypothetical protein
MLNPRLILVAIVIFGIGVVLFQFKDKISSSANLPGNNQSADTSNKEILPEKKPYNKPGEQGGTGTSGDTSADSLDDKWLEECPKNKFIVGSSEMGGMVTLGKEKHVINNKTVELCCIASLEEGQSVDSVDGKECRDTTKNVIGLQKENGKFMPTTAVYIEDGKNCVINYDSEGNASDSVCTAL